MGVFGACLAIYLRRVWGCVRGCVCRCVMGRIWGKVVWLWMCKGVFGGCLEAV